MVFVNKLNVFTIGGVVQPGMDIIELVPNKEKLIVEAQLPVSDVGFVAINQRVIVRLAGPQRMDYGFINASVDKISPDTSENDSGEPIIK